MYQGLQEQAHVQGISLQQGVQGLPEPTHAQKILDLQSRVMHLEKQVGELLSAMVGTVGANLNL